MARVNYLKKQKRKIRMGILPVRSELVRNVGRIGSPE
jgi:hypothetical protein